MLIRRFLFSQLHPGSDVVEDDLPVFRGEVSIYSSAIAVYHAPSDLCGVNGMHREWIRAVSSWRRGPARYDCVFVNADETAEGMRGLSIARVRLFFSVHFGCVTYPCALVHWFSPVGDHPDADTGMWIVKPDQSQRKPVRQVIHLNSIVRAAHLIGVYGQYRVPRALRFEHSLDAFQSFYVNKYIDHHAFEIAF